MAYRIGWPFWKLAARLGFALKLRVYFHYDPEVKRYWTSSPDLPGLHCEADTVPEIKEYVDDCARLLLECELKESALKTPISKLTYADA